MKPNRTLAEDRCQSKSAGPSEHAGINTRRFPGLLPDLTPTEFPADLFGIQPKEDEK